MKIGIIVAMDKEFEQLLTLTQNLHTEHHGDKDFSIGTIGSHEIILQRCGIGKVNATIGAVEMISHYRPELIISSGVAGGADAQLQVTEVVVGTQYAYHDAYCGTECAYGQLLGLPEKFSTAQSFIDKALHLDSKTPIHAGLIVTGDWFVDSQEKMREILQHFPAAKAVDMESCAIAHTCYLYHVPFVSFRIISDVPLRDHKAQMYYDFWDKMAEGSFEVTRQFLNSL